jgi:glycosyltransferase involved in cell wall biosynthesis
MNIHQIMAGYADGDAISNEAVQLRRIFRQWGLGSEIYVDPACVSPSLRQDCRSLSDYAAAAGDICLHHYGIASPATEAFLQSPARKIMVYHNITPAEYFIGFDDAVAARLRTARSVLREVALRSDAVWTDSRFNASELTAEGIEAVQVLPLPFSRDGLDGPTDPQIIDACSGPEKNILFVGRIAPNKRIEDTILAFAWYHRSINPRSRLLIVGSPRSAPRYFAMLRMLVGDLDLPNVCFAGFASPAGLSSYYRVADLYVSTSVHEGYCLPLVEAMAHGVPVIARAAGGTPEAMDGAGVLYEDLAPAELGALFDRVLSDGALRRDILTSQKDRIQRAANRDLSAELQALMAGMRV